MVDYITECENHAQTVNVLRRLKRGEITLDALEVTDQNRWTILPGVVSDVEIIEGVPAN